MGLDTTHDAWHGPYSAFNRFRQAICRAAGGNFPPHSEGATLPDGQPMLPNHYYLDDEYEAAHPGLSAFLRSSDCDGEFSPEVAAQMANDIEKLLPALSAMDKEKEDMPHRGGYYGAALQYIAGCREAAAAGEPLVYG
jgi:hypothetical protein